MDSDDEGTVGFGGDFAESSFQRDPSYEKREEDNSGDSDSEFTDDEESLEDSNIVAGPKDRRILVSGQGGAGKNPKFQPSGRFRPTEEESNLRWIENCKSAILLTLGEKWETIVAMLKLTRTQIPKKFMVFAAFFLIDQTIPRENHDPNRVRVLAIGSGSKWTLKSNLKWTMDKVKSERDQGKRLMDSHAEILARRALHKLLYDHLEALNNNNGQDRDDLILEATPTDDGFRLKPHLRLHLFISKPPCGGSVHPEQVLAGHLYAKVENYAGITTRVLECLPDLTTPSSPYLGNFMSCSDKLAKWNVVGVQGALLAGYLEPIYLSGLTVASSLLTPSAEEALYVRFEKDLTLAESLQDAGYRKNTHPIVFANAEEMIKWRDYQNSNLKKAVAKNWYEFLGAPASPTESNVEVTHSQTGGLFHEEDYDEEKEILFKPRTDQSKYLHEYSRISKRGLMERYMKICETQNVPPRLDEASLAVFGTYRQLKDQSSDYQEAKQAMLKVCKKSESDKWIHNYGGFDLFNV